MCHPPVPPPGRSGLQQQAGPYGQFSPTPPTHAPAHVGPGALGLTLFLSGFVVIVIPAVNAPIVTQMSLGNPGSISPVAVSGLSAGIRVLGLLIGIGGLLTVRNTSWPRRGIGAGILAVTMALTFVLSFALGFIVHQLSLQTSVSTAVAVSIVASTVLGALAPVGWISAWLVTRKATVVGCLIALALGALVPLLCSTLAQMFIARSRGSVEVAIVVAVVQAFCFVGGVLLAELAIRSAVRKRRELDVLRQSVR